MELKRIGLVNIAMHGRDAGVLKGFLRYAQHRTSWLVYDGGEHGTAWVEYLSDHDLDGVTANISSSEEAAILKSLGIPVVNLSQATPESRDFYTIEVDPGDIAAAAAQHFLEHGFRNFAFFDPFPGRVFMAERGAAFRDYLADRRHECAIYENFVPFPTYAPKDLLTDLDLPIVEWLEQLPKPVGVFTGMDRAGRKLCWICNLAGIHVPEDVAVLGVDNFDFICETSFPLLSSVRVPAEQLGYRAAELLDTMMQGGTPPEKLTLLPAAGVVVRQSTDVMAIDDRAIAAALRFIRTHFTERISVTDVARAAGTNRRSLERRFKTALRRTPLQEIHRMMIEHAGNLLRDGDASIPDIASRSGFRDGNHLNIVFRKATGQSPSAFRRRFRAP